MGRITGRITGRGFLVEFEGEAIGEVDGFADEEAEAAWGGGGEGWVGEHALEEADDEVESGGVRVGLHEGAWLAR